MLVLVLVLFSALVLKDTTDILYGQYIRVAAEIVVGVYGTLWMFRNASSMLFRKYWIFFTYLAVLAATALLAARWAWVVFESLSLGAILAFFIALVEQQQDLDRSHMPIFALLGIEFAAACFAGLVLYLVNTPAALDTSVDPWRYKGVFGKPAGVAAASGLLLALALFSRWHPVARVGGAALGVVNLALSESRTGLVAAVISTVLTVLIYTKKRLVLIWTVATGVTALLYVHLATGFGIPASITQAMRLGTVGTLSGRTEMWSLALDAFRSSPVLGYGFTLGSGGLEAMHSKIVDEYGAKSPMAIQGGLFDNGYIQSLMDSGIIGFAIYIMIIAFAVRGVLQQRKHQDSTAMFACLIFMAVGNIGESLIFAAATPHSVFFWFLAISAVGLTMRGPRSRDRFSPPDLKGAFPSKPVGVRPGQRLAL